MVNLNASTIETKGEPAPIVLFAFNRPKHLRATLMSLKNNTLAHLSDLFIFIDGPKNNFSIDQTEKIEQVKKIAREEQWCKKVTIVESPVNKGLAKSVIDGVSEIVEKFGKVIVLEDDLVSSAYFLQFMNDALTLYENEDRVISATGYIYPVRQELPATYFLKGADCWGWATWKRGWDLLEKDGKNLLTEIEKNKLENDFDFYGSYPYTQMLRDQIAGKNNSWAILWYASAYLKNKLTIYPGQSLIQNIGNDGSGTHSGVTNKWEVSLTEKPVSLGSIELKENTKAKKIIADYFREIMGTEKGSLIGKLKNKFRAILK